MIKVTVNPTLKKYGTQVIIWLVVAALGAIAYGQFGVRVPLPPFPAVPTVIPSQAEPSEPLYFCGRIETVRDSLVTKPWPSKKITWLVDTNLSPLPRVQVIEAFRVAWASWAANIDIEPVFVEDASSAMVISKFGDYDGSGKVLAWSELADGTTTPKHQLYDRAERWGVFGGAGSGIDLVRVAAHEIGHVLGLVHDEGKGNALMDPIYSKTIRVPTEQDVKRALDLGYKPKPAPKSDPNPPGLVISFPVNADAGAVADALKKAGFKVEAPKP